MTYYMPTQIIESDNVVQLNSNIFNKYGSKALIVTGKNSAKINGALKDVLEVLNQLEMSYRIFDDIIENPPVENIIEGAKSYPEADLIIGIGGGSPIDAAKAIGVLIKNPELEPYAALYELTNLEALPLIAIPTTGGTGTETTPYAILTDHKRGTKVNFSQKVFPKVALMDVGYYMFMPLQVRNNTCIDALTHLVESYMNTNGTKYSEYIVEEGLKLWGSVKASLLQTTIAKEDMTVFMNASTLAGMAISQTGTSLPHGMGYPLTYEKGIAHGKANALIMAAYLGKCKDQIKVNKILDFLGFLDLVAFGSYIDELVGTIKIPREDILRYSEAMVSNQGKLKNHPDPITLEDIIGMYEASSKE